MVPLFRLNATLLHTNEADNLANEAEHPSNLRNSLLQNPDPHSLPPLPTYLHHKPLPPLPIEQCTEEAIFHLTVPQFYHARDIGALVPVGVFDAQVLWLLA